MQKTVKISGPVSLTIIRDPQKDRYFYLFGDIHASMEGNCSQAEKGLRCDRPSFKYEGVVPGNSNCWTISALIHEVLRYNGKKNISTKFYREESVESGKDHIISTDEYQGRKIGRYKEPRNITELQVTKKRLQSSGFGWMQDVDFLLQDKSYGSSVEIVNADARLWKNIWIAPPARCLAGRLVKNKIAPCPYPYTLEKMSKDLSKIVKVYAQNGDGDEYRFRLEHTLLAFEEYVSLLENIAQQPYKFFEHFVVPKNYAQATREIINYIPRDSKLMQDLVESLYLSIDEKSGVMHSSGVLISASAAEQAKLFRVNKEAARKVEEYARFKLETLAFEYEDPVAKVSNILQDASIFNPRQVETLLYAIPILHKVSDLSLTTTGLITDIYTLSHMLRTEAKHNILFFGNKHIENYSQFLVNYMHFEIVEEHLLDRNAPEVIRCVESAHIAQLLSLYEARNALFV